MQTSSKNQYIRPEEEIKPNLFRKITRLDKLMMVILRFENGPMTEADPYHEHPHEQITYVIKGELLFIIEDQEHHLKTGDTINIKSGQKHTIQTLTESVELMDTFSPVREDFL